MNDDQDLLSDYSIERITELLDQINSAFFWILDHAKKNHIPIDQAMGLHIRRIGVLLNEITHFPSFKILLQVQESDDSYHPNSSDEDLPEPKGVRFIKRPITFTRSARQVGLHPSFP